MTRSHVLTLLSCHRYYTSQKARVLVLVLALALALALPLALVHGHSVFAIFSFLFSRFGIFFCFFLSMIVVLVVVAVVAVVALASAVAWECIWVVYKRYRIWEGYMKEGMYESVYTREGVQAKVSRDDYEAFFFTIAIIHDIASCHHTIPSHTVSSCSCGGSRCPLVGSCLARPNVVRFMLHACIDWLINSFIHSCYWFMLFICVIIRVIFVIFWLVIIRIDRVGVGRVDTSEMKGNNENNEGKASEGKRRMTWQQSDSICCSSASILVPFPKNGEGKWW